MNLNWKTIDRYLMGEAWTGSRIAQHAHVLCEEIGPRWSSSEAESQAIRYIQEQMVTNGLDGAKPEPFDLHTWSYSKAEALKSDGQPIAQPDGRLRQRVTRWGGHLEPAVAGQRRSAGQSA